jgi:hypothetical protein
MDLVPVKKYSLPNYADKQTIMQNPKLLKTIPERWRGNMYVCAALSSLLMFTFTGCEQKGVSSTDSPNAKLGVAPIFEHGTGRGSFGCSSIAPPAFISEEEAFQVIQEEGNKYGIVFKKEGLELKNVKIPETKSMLTLDNGKSSAINASHKGTLLLDGYDKEKKIGYEFISTEDYGKWKAKSNMQSTVEEFDFLTTAKLLQAGMIENKSEAAVGIFYNPMASSKPGQKLDIKAIREYTTETAKEDLREQVKDFLQWLKAQGII